MKFALLSLLLSLLAAFAMAAAPQQSVIVSYPNETPDSVVEQAKKAIVEAGGIITHEYNIIKGFAAKAPAKVLESIRTWGAEYNALVEVDQEMHTMETGLGP
ncbi:hypothetical protein W97_08914 [Coniosporium apollinis CBS 100218]|uniref:Inhibitor I9 domain-containing protein n=1 Tax=Coniosporium apollinis (strain CBS 100218) TaxID=1168221 RepID=R7Z676_CONA1|nr:uncharacterized protein W97_08914 [Coniosporium apollinis CBS 100218]EON69662.1 hypothetical protein W97_08914 [Coniosporium apollinis CBS 100218]